MEVVIGIPTYNNEDTIKQTIEIFEEQTIPPTELIFCDGGNDNTSDIINKKANKVDDFNITVLSQEGDGVADAYNQILSYLDHDYELFGTLQTNYKVDNKWVENAIKIHQEHPEVDIVNSSSGVNRQLDPTEPSYFSGRCFVAKSGVLEKVNGWDENFLRGEDWDIRIRLTGEGITAFGADQLAYQNFADDPPITLHKALRKPTSVMFLAKYGLWYMKYHPSHVLGDIIGALSVLGICAIPFTLPYGTAIVLIATGTYLAGHNLLMGDVNGSRITGVLRKQILDGIGVWSSIAQLLRKNYNWNMTGFNPDNIESQMF